ncbi:hypothetical protein RV04_GL001375 [Enterococcus hermanniensis]|uniref:ABC transporter domain-containing protein n=2 Tax=Enterococcus hermanniensis TaxID=249189 RepID=A0A1L8TPF3_9ENTE|nr:hypothetical protein RV04_GL001375 [Enterococcus hermanniensis]
MEAKNLSKVYGKTNAVQNLNLQIKAGELTAYLGTNGAGKSTTIKMLTGILKPTSGSIYYQGEVLDQVAREKFDQNLGVVFQGSVMDNELSVQENLLIRAALYKDISKDEVKKLMAKTGVISYAQKRYGDLSGGMRRKVDITRALISSPKILFLDEPTTGLDAQSREDIWLMLNLLKKQNNLAIFLTTHYLEEAEEADNIYILEQGTIIESGSAQQLKKNYGQQKLSLFLTDNPNSLIDALKERHYKVEQEEEKVTVYVKGKNEAIKLLSQYGEKITDFSYQPTDMTEIFLALTGRKLQNEGNR